MVLSKKENQEALENLYDDLVDQRTSLSHKRENIAIYSALELRDISIKYDYAVIARENLSWVGNTMQNGRWNCGEFFTRLQDKCEEIGLSSVWVSAWKTSQSCSQCGNMHKKILVEGDKQFYYDTPDRVVHCEECGYSADRDVNAAINIAMRAVHLVEKELEEYSQKPEKFSDPEPVKKFSRSRVPLWLRDKQRKDSLKSRKEREKEEKREKKIVSRSLKREQSSKDNSVEDRIPHVKGSVLPLEVVVSRKKEVSSHYVSLLCPSLSKCFRGSVIDGGVTPALVIACDDDSRLIELSCFTC